MAAPLAPALIEVPSASDSVPVQLLEENTSATRHLSAGAYLDPGFCLTALREIYCQTKRVVAPSYGFDAIAVLGHCLRARRAMIVRDTLLVGLLVSVSWLSVLITLITLSMLLVAHAMVVSLNVVRAAFRYLMDGRHFRDSIYPEAASRSGGGQSQRDDDRVPGRRRFALLWLENVVAQIGTRLLGIVAAYLLLTGLDMLLALRVWHAPVLHVRFGIPLIYAAVGAPALAFLVPALTRTWNRLQLRKLVPGRSPECHIRTRRLTEIEHQNRGNTTVYSGYRPFVGSGAVLRRWNITQRLVRPLPKIVGVVDETELDREFKTPPFQAREINDYVRRYIADLAVDPVPERQLSNLTVVDRVFVAGTKISDLQLNTPHGLMADIIRHPTAPARHYLTCQVVSWGGELVTTVYVHFAVQGRTLYVELNVVGLLPCDERYMIVDKIGGTGLRRLLRDAGRATLEAPLLVAAAPASLARATADQAGVTLSTRFARRRMHLGYDYGATTSLREIGTPTVIPDPMQQQDIVKYGRVVERRVLAAILDFLESRQVDVTEYRQSSLTVLSAGVVNAGSGTVTVGGNVAGTQVNNTTTDGGA
jgi:hypothetical protein